MTRNTWRRDPRRAAGSTVIVLTVLVAAVALVTSPAYAYHSDGREGTYACIDCHGDVRDQWTGEGPHGYYLQSTLKCRMCHTVHNNNPSAILLLPQQTITDSCFTCHDGTGAVGVYSSISARGGAVQGEHTVDTTASVPGGSDKLKNVLGCYSCHAVHRATRVESFTGDSHQAMYHGFSHFSNRLLRDDVGDTTRGAFTEYGPDWCAACHDQRMSVSVAHNHPVESSATPSHFSYQNVARMTDTYTLTTELGPLGYTNLGYVMPSPRTGDQVGHDPICQQCHEDSRDVGDVGDVAEFEAALKDYGVYPRPVNPPYVTFPHQTTNRWLLVEQDDDLCLNCHPTPSLP